jgi:sarcosine oxidase delta subunit
MLDAIVITCPFCGERFEALVDASGGSADYIEDCPVCCRPIELHLHAGDDGEIDRLDAERE